MSKVKCCRNTFLWLFVCNAVLNTGVLPDRLNYAILQPSFKKGNKQDIFNYRPISLLTNFSKIIEKLICTRLHGHIDNILVNEQYGFRTHTSTTQASYMLLNGIQTAMNNNLVVGSIFL
jgi:hypothetical protein